MASAFEISSEYNHDILEILDRIKYNPSRSPSTSTGSNNLKSFSNSKKNRKDHDNFLRRTDTSNTKALTQIVRSNNLYRLLMRKTERQQGQQDPISLSASANSLIQQKTNLKSKRFEINLALENAKQSSYSSKNNLNSYQTNKLETQSQILNSLSLFEKSPNTKQSSLNSLNGESISIIDEVDVLPLNGKSTLFTSVEAIGLVGVIFAVFVLACWIKKFILSFFSKKSLIKTLKIEKKSNTNKAKQNISVFRQTFILTRPILMSRIMDTNTESDKLNDRSNNDSNKSTPYFTPSGTFDEDRIRFEYPVPSPSISGCRGIGKLSSNEELLFPISITPPSAPESVQISLPKSANNANSTNNSIQTESHARRFSTERRPCSPAWSYMAHLLTNQVSNKSQYETYDNLYAAGSSPLFSAMSAAISFNASRPSPPASASAVEGSSFMSRQNCRSPKVHDKEGDKENEIPTKTMHKQQNSPLGIEVNRLAATKFSFSPKDINDKSSAAPAAEGRYVVKSSPTLSSAGYTKNGDYFKFPEVDLFSPGTIHKTSTYHIENKNDDELELELAYPSNNLLQHDKLKVTSSSEVDAQATRRARLKSISLDSEGAKLVEDNLGVPVEELIEMTTPTIMSSSFIVTSPNKQNKNISNLKNISTANLECDQSDSRDDADDSCCFEEDPHNGQYVLSSNKSNNLSLKVMWYNDVNQNSHKEPIIRTPPPKTPTLGKTKQKAISFDSSDSSKFLSSSSSMSRRLQDRDKNDALNEINFEASPPKAVSLMHISSLSMPGTPKRNFSPNKKYNHVGNRINRTKQRQLSSNITPSTLSLSSFDHGSSNTKCVERQGFILKLDSFNENCIDDLDYGDVELSALDDDGENYFINIDDSATAVAAPPVLSSTSSTSNTNKLIHDYNQQSAIKKLSPDYLIGSNLQTQKCATALSLSNSNLKTLPEVMTLSDFSVSRPNEEIYGDTLKVSSSVGLPGSIGGVGGGGGGGGVKQSNLLSSRAAARSSLLQRRGSNHSLTLNLNESYGSLKKGLSASNYSLCSNSQYNLSNSIHSLTGAKQQAVLLKGNSIAIPSTFIHNENNLITQGPGFEVNSGNKAEKKNLLQRRGSNTSLTLNIHGSSYVHLNRFKSHSSLNITSHHPQQQNVLKTQQQQLHHAIKDPILNENSSNSKQKGLLERRGSNASLTINLQCNALAVSNLRGSACSLSSINTNQLEEEYETRRHQENEFLDADTTAANSVCVGQQRKFFSSENLNNLNNRSQYSKLNQTHMRNSTKTCFGSVSDLNNYCQLPISLIGNQGESILPKTLHISQANSLNSKLTLSKTKQVIPESFITHFEQSNLCSCTGLRNITTRPLSPQTTSEDFKMYLANVQLLQNASNVLDGYELMKLNYVFEKSYNDDENLHNNTTSGDVETFDEQKQWKSILSSFFHIDLPDENEQKRLIRSLHQEFWDLPTNHQEKPMVFGSQSKNRYKSILPNEHSRVQLIAEEGGIEAPYINANYIKGPDYVQKSYIATQGPLPNTIYDFWLMIFQNIRKHDEQQKCIRSPQPYCTNKNSKFPSSPIEFDEISQSCSTESTNRQLKSKRQKIIMLTNFVENNRQKCATYFPINENDIFLITSTNDEVNNNDIKIFYSEYFKKHETSSSNYDTFEIEINDKNIINYLPKVNYFIVKNNGIIMKNGFSIRELQCLFCCNTSNKSSSNNYNNASGSSKEAAGDVNDKLIQIVHSFSSLHYWYPDWPDHRSPSDISVLLEISQHMLMWENSYDQPLPVIHCSAGIGRTGCMAAILNAICQIRASFPLKAINAYQHETTTTATTKTTTAITCCKNSNNIQSNLSDVDNLQSFSSQSFPYRNNSSCSNNKLKNSCKNINKIIQSPTESNVDKNRVQCIVDVNDGFSSNSNSSCSSSNAETKNNVYCKMAAVAEAAPIRKSPSIHVDILGIVCNLRLQRGGMVQNSEQYELIHRAMCLYLKRVLKLIYEAQI